MEDVTFYIRVKLHMCDLPNDPNNSMGGYDFYCMEENLVLWAKSETIGSAGKGSSWNDGTMESWNDGFKVRKPFCGTLISRLLIVVPQYSTIPTFQYSGLSAP